MLDTLETKKQMKKLTHSSYISELVDEYLDSKPFIRLKGSTQKEYELTLKIAMNTPTHTGKTVGGTKLNLFGNNHASYAYEQWLERGISRANKISTVLSIVFNTAIYKDILNRNPMVGVKRVPNKQRKVDTRTGIHLPRHSIQAQQVEVYRSYSTDGIRVGSACR